MGKKGRYLGGEGVKKEFVEKRLENMGEVS